MRNTGSSLKNHNNNPGDPVVKTQSFHYRGHRFDPWLENEDPTSHYSQKVIKLLLFKIIIKYLECID